MHTEIERRASPTSEADYTDLCRKSTSRISKDGGTTFGLKSQKLSNSSRQKAKMDEKICFAFLSYNYSSCWVGSSVLDDSVGESKSTNTFL